MCAHTVSMSRARDKDVRACNNSIGCSKGSRSAHPTHQKNVCRVLEDQKTPATCVSHTVVTLLVINIWVATNR